MTLVPNSTVSRLPPALEKSHPLTGPSSPHPEGAPLFLRCPSSLWARSWCKELAAVMCVLRAGTRPNALFAKGVPRITHVTVLVVAVLASGK